jgi:ubiquinone/menaquinone biosynthesis C-methylase UbiE
MIKPKEVIAKFTVEELAKTADDYFRSIPNPSQLMAKPFSSLLETPEILQNMGLLLSGLRLAKTMTVLEFAAGTCWFSRYLNQLQCKTISCDVSPAALEIGQRLFREFPIVGKPIAEPTFLHFDGHRIDLPDNSVDRIVCNDGFHHIPNQGAVLAEMARVLKPGGIAGFSEPGPFHSQHPQSQSEMRNYNVLENDIILPEIYASAQKYGFTSLRIKAFGDLEISLRLYKFITHRLTRRLLALFSPALSKASISKSIFFLHKGNYLSDSRSHEGLAHSIKSTQSAFSVELDRELPVQIKVTNTGVALWLRENLLDIGVVRIGTHLYAETGALLNHEFSRHELGGAIKPGDSFETEIRLRFSQRGNFKVSIDLVSEQVCWFENLGSKPNLISVKVS